MHDAHDFLKVLATVLCVAAVTTVLFQRLRQPVVLGYILAGLIVGPHVPIPLVADRAIVQTLSELGVILLMFSLGLEFSLARLARVGLTAGPTAAFQSSIMLWLGFLVGRAFGWSVVESLFTGAIIAISSTTIIAKAFDEQRVSGGLRELVVGILIVEDLIAVLLMAALTAIASSGDGLSAGTLVRSSLRLGSFLAALVIVGLLVVPRTIRAIQRLGRPETTLVASVGLCFATALLALEFGYSVALGAFIAGSLVAESGEQAQIEPLVRPIRDVFAALFFVSVGMLIDPTLIARHGPAVATLCAVVVVGKVVSVAVGAFLTGHGTRTSVQAGMSLAQIGEFSFIIAGLGISLGVTREFVFPVAVAVSALTTLTTPWLIRASGPAAALVDRKLPGPLQTFTALYGSWLERMRAAPRRQSAGQLARLGRLLVLDAALLAGLVIGASLQADALAGFVERELAITRPLSRVLVVAAAMALAAPLVVGILRITRRFGVILAEMALPTPGGEQIDLGAAPRRALVGALQLAVMLPVGFSLLALTQPFLPGPQGALVLALPLGVLGFALWRSARNLEGHVRAGAETIVEVLGAQLRKGIAAPDARALAQVAQLLPGLGEPVAVRIRSGSAAAGRTLAELAVRALTGATVLAIIRGEEEVIIPSATEALRAGDVLALTGSREAVESARSLLEGGDLAGADARGPDA